MNFTIDTFLNQYLPPGGTRADAVFTLTAHGGAEPALVPRVVGLIADKSGSMSGDKMDALQHALAAVLDRGDVAEADARRDPRPHALLHCLGTTDFSTATPCPEPSVITVAPAGRWLLLCSDGLWNYAETAVALAQAASQGLHGDAADLCARLVAFARAAGGRDNITAVAARW